MKKISELINWQDTRTKDNLLKRVANLDENRKKLIEYLQEIQRQEDEDLELEDLCNYNPYLDDE